MFYVNSKVSLNKRQISAITVVTACQHRVSTVTVTDTWFFCLCRLAAVAGGGWTVFVVNCREFGPISTNRPWRPNQLRSPPRNVWGWWQNRKRRQTTESRHCRKRPPAWGLIWYFDAVTLLENVFILFFFFFCFFCFSFFLVNEYFIYHT